MLGVQAAPNRFEDLDSELDAGRYDVDGVSGDIVDASAAAFLGAL